MLLTLKKISPRRFSEALQTLYGEHVKFLLFAPLWLLSAYVISRAQSMEIWAVSVSMLLFSLPIFTTTTYSSTIRMEYKLAPLAHTGWLDSLLSRRFLRMFWWLIFSLVMSFLLFLQIHVYTAVEWGVLVVGIFVFPITFALIRGFILEEFREDIAHSMALAWSRGLCAVVMVLLYVLVTATLGEWPEFESIQAAISEYKNQADDWSGSELVKEGLSWAAYFDGLKAYALGHVGRIDALIALLILVIVNFAIYYNVCLGWSCFLISRAGFAQTRMIPRTGEAIFQVAALATLAIGFIYLPGLAQLEGLVSSSGLSGIRGSLERTTVEVIDGNVYREGTRDQIVAAARAKTDLLEATLQNLRNEADSMFTRLETEAVNEYLDWYYSLPAEYLRLAKMLVGDLERYMVERLSETFQQPKWYQDFNEELSRTLAVTEEARTELRQVARDILSRNGLDSMPADAQVARTVSLDDILERTFPKDIIRLEDRSGVAGGAAGASSVASGVIAASTFKKIILKKITTKVATKSVFKLAAKALMKPLASLGLKVSVGATGGAATGAAIGSIVPFVGTAIGATVGGVLGALTVGVAVDAALLQLEEALNRENFERDLVNAIQETRREFAQEYLGPPELTVP